MATKRKRSLSSWEYVIRRKGLLPKPIYLTFSDEKEGDEYVRRVEAMLERGFVPPDHVAAPGPAKTLREVIANYQQALAVPAADAALLAVVSDRCGSTKLTDIDFGWAERWVQSMKHDLNLSPSTIRHYAGATARCLDWLARKHPELIPGNPLRLLPKRYASYSETDARVTGNAKTDEARDRRLVPGEEERIRVILRGDKPEGRQRPFELKHRIALNLLFDLAIETAMRLREMFTLAHDQVDLDRRTIFLDKTKNGSKRQVPLSSVAVEALGVYLLVNETEGRLFPWWDGEQATLAKTTALLSRQFGRIFEAAGCPDLRFHDLRHEATSRLFERTNLSDLQIAKITGHQDPRMLARYANLRASDLAEHLW